MAGREKMGSVRRLIEDVFKNVKTFLKIRPFFVNPEKHVKTVYTICILAYFLNKFLTNQIKSAGEKDYLNSKELYAPFKNIDFVVSYSTIGLITQSYSNISVNIAYCCLPFSKIGTKGILN